MESLLKNLSIDQIHEILNQYPFILLESQLPNHLASDRSYIAVKPKRSITAYGSTIEVTREGEKDKFEMNPWEALKEFKQERQCWLFGYLGYDLKNFIEDLESNNSALSNTPDLYFMEPEILLTVSQGEVDSLMSGGVGDEGAKTTLPGSLEMKVQPLIKKSEYIKTVKSIQELIHSGDFYEMNYTIPLTGAYAGDPYWLYSRMREINPVPFGAYISHDDFSVCCSSPERFLKKVGRSIRSEPIKGTAERASDTETDEINRRELLNEKNRAENLMIVDLVRHDLSKVSKTGSVQVSKLYDIQTFGTVHQLISVVESTARQDVDSIDIIMNCFPMGSMTGAPKIEVMKTTDQLEIYKRGIYSGAIGYFTPEDDFDFNVVIRTAIIQGESLIYPVGGAITSDSDPESEWEECMIKSRNVTEVFKKEFNL